MADSLFSNFNYDDNSFEEVHLVYYSSDLIPLVTKSKNEFLGQIDNTRVGGMTNFADCFDYIEERMLKAQKESEFFIVFLTDGEETCNSEKALKMTF